MEYILYEGRSENQNLCEPAAGDIDFSKINATFKNGGLTVVLPKTATAQSSAKKIDVKAG